MKVHFGNQAPHEQVTKYDADGNVVGGELVPVLDGAAAVTTCSVSDARDDDGNYLASYVVGSDAREIKDHLFDNPGIVQHLPGNTAIVSVVKSFQATSTKKPAWVAVDAGERDAAEAEDFERFWADFWNIPRGMPDDVEDTHWTEHNNKAYPPGESRPTEAELSAIDDQIRATAAAEAEAEAQPAGEGDSQ